MGFRETAQQYLTGAEYQFQRAKYAWRGGEYSAFGEQRLLWKYIKELFPQTHSHTAVDIGAGNGMRWSNTYSLFLQGWSGLGIEANNRKFASLQRAYRDFPNVQSRNSLVDPFNVRQLLADAAIPKNFGVLSLDIDGNDYWVLQALLREFRPALVVTEINEKIPPPLRFVVKFDPHFQLRHHFYGHSIAALEDLCEKHNYGLLALEYNNAFLAPREIGKGRFTDSASAYREGYLNRQDRQQRFPLNQDLECLHSLEPTKAVTLLRDFYAREVGNYFLAIEKEEFRRELRGP